MLKLSLREFEPADLLVLYAQGIGSAETQIKHTRILRLVLCEIFEDIMRDIFEEYAAGWSAGTTLPVTLFEECDVLNFKKLTLFTLSAFLTLIITMIITMDDILQM